jgi:hypothetical protein
MEEVDYIGPAIFGAPALLAFVHWAISLFMTRGKENYTRIDLRQLWTDSLPFLRTQWHMIALSVAIALWFQLKPTPEVNDPNFAVETFLSLSSSSAIYWILGLFYVSYLAAPKYPGRVATIGFCSLATYVIGDMFVLLLGLIGTALFVVPGLIIFVRSCLFLPIFVTHESKPLVAIKQSWSLTKGKYWLISRYMGLPAAIMLAGCLLSELPTTLAKSDIQHVSLGWQAFMLSTTAITECCNLIIFGLLYQLYDRLSREEPKTIT